MFGWSDITWDRIKEGILYPTPCWLVIGYDKLSHHLSYPIFNKTRDIISGGIYYPPSFFFFLSLVHWDMLIPW